MYVWSVRRDSSIIVARRMGRHFANNIRSILPFISSSSSSSLLLLDLSSTALPLSASHNVL